ncbi:MAG TPA: ABC transporter permease [Candidatus Hydrogenedentes bacterium]|nr:ABC transporter permease [Candidatus Hydrogenedentota bacterium]HOT49900.1 ABC transporter permease [Candidatus Hydrogenedentota bacterium]HOV74983.1 ABC transporter permease [Candidatus Hydrogenedentota bacterium]HPC16753.1 ABC transporter permease [Candidatus Hydrogenedentota bacterium]HRT21388.1 ABC transporter permease [Candidatus Hydrogenedentota bacterium]
MLIPIKYNIRYLAARWRGTMITAATFALVVATFIIVMSLAQGIERALTTTANPLNVIIMRSGVQAEGQSEIGMEQYRIARGVPGVATDENGDTITAPEILAMVNKPRYNGKMTNLQIRGVERMAFVLRPDVRIVEGRMFRPGLREAIVARTISNRFQGFRLGDTPRLGRGHFTIVGIFDARGTAYDSEVWADAREIMQEFDRERYSTVVVRARDEDAVQRIKDYVDKDPRLKLMAKDEAAYYAEQTKTARPVRAFAMFLAFTMAIGACFAGMNTMYANVANRVREIGTLRILGFTPAAVLASFLIESVCLALIGGAVGCIAALPINGLATGTTNFDSFTEITFHFTITPQLMLRGMVFAAFMGLFGGFLPAWSASRQPVLAALRQV